LVTFIHDLLQKNDINDVLVEKGDFLLSLKKDMNDI
jgi:hypothetical protein